jgi:hypothetical protein
MTGKTQAQRIADATNTATRLVKYVKSKLGKEPKRYANVRRHGVAEMNLKRMGIQPKISLEDNKEMPRNVDYDLKEVNRNE